MKKIKIGDKVKIHYIQKLKDDTIFNSLTEEITVGNKDIIQGIENAIIGMSEDETKVFTLSPENAYGDYKDELILVIERSHFPADFELQMGKMFEIDISLPEGVDNKFTVVEINDDIITLNANHPLAGKEVAFEVKLLEIL